MKKNIRLATRQSPLALWQAQYVQKRLLALWPSFKIELIPLLTQADKDTDRPLTEIGGKSLFVKELQSALLEQRADIAVHSVKDMSVFPTTQLHLAAITERADPRDVLVSTHYKSLMELPLQATVGTSSPRRSSQLKALRPDLKIVSLRGNVGTRLEKLQSQHWGGIIIAAAGLERLGLSEHISEYLNVDYFIPAIGQGALGVECRAQDAELINLLQNLDHPETHLCVQAERAVNQCLGGNCYTPVAAHARLINGKLQLHGMVGDLEGKLIFKANIEGDPQQATQLGLALAEQLLAQGAQSVLNHFK